VKDWREQHGDVILSFVEHLNTNTDDYVLKGGTALYLCYGLDRFSEDIDLDGRSKGLVAQVDSYCAENGYSYRVAKDTATVERCLINYGNDQHPLKVEASYRRGEMPESETTTINDIKVYTIDQLCIMKTGAYEGRDKIRDVYDVAFICNNYFDKLSPQAVSSMRSALEHKGIVQLDYIVKTQPDELIDADKLADSFLDAYERLGLLLDDDEKEFIEKLAPDVEGLPVDRDDDDGASGDWVDQ
jgi:predicted nucleotidyltransferase component of viral defense system